MRTSSEDRFLCIGKIYAVLASIILKRDHVMAKRLSGYLLEPLLFNPVEQEGCASTCSPPLCTPTHQISSTGECSIPVNVRCLREDRPNRPYPRPLRPLRPSHPSHNPPYLATMSRSVPSLEKSGSLLGDGNPCWFEPPVGCQGGERVE